MAKSPNYEEIEKADMKGKSVVVTGANSGLGYESCIWFAKHGGDLK